MLNRLFRQNAVYMPTFVFHTRAISVFWKFVSELKLVIWNFESAGFNFTYGVIYRWFCSYCCILIHANLNRWQAKQVFLVRIVANLVRELNLHLLWVLLQLWIGFFVSDKVVSVREFQRIIGKSIGNLIFSYNFLLFLINHCFYRFVYILLKLLLQPFFQYFGQRVFLLYFLGLPIYLLAESLSQFRRNFARGFYCSRTFDRCARFLLFVFIIWNILWGI